MQGYGGQKHPLNPIIPATKQLTISSFFIIAQPSYVERVKKTVLAPAKATRVGSKKGPSQSISMASQQTLRRKSRLFEHSLH